MLQCTVHIQLNQISHQFTILTGKHAKDFDPRHHLVGDPERDLRGRGATTLKVIHMMLNAALRDDL